MKLETDRNYGEGGVLYGLHRKEYYGTDTDPA